MKESSNDKTADNAKAIAHPARIKILLDLAEQNKCTCGQIVDMHPLAQSTISQHLKELKKSGYIKGIVEGISTCYCLDYKQIQNIKNEFDVLFKKLLNK